MNLMGEKECPGCDETFILDDGKDERRYRNHLEDHIHTLQESMEGSDDD